MAILGRLKLSQMKNPLYFLFFITLFVSCKSNTKTLAADTVVQTKPVVNQVRDQDLIKKFSPIVQGVWVKKAYIEEVGKTQSPLAATDQVNDITTMYIDTKKLVGDSLFVLCGWGNHDSSDLELKFQPGRANSSIKFGDGDLVVTIEKADTLLTFTRFDQEKKKIVNTIFIKAMNKEPDNDLGYGMYYLINKVLMSGNYILTDTLGKVSEVTFDNYGNVSGFLNHSKYEVNIDLNSDPMDNLDMIFFTDKYGKQSSGLKGDFSFKFIADTLNLYDSHPNTDSTELILGKRVYKLVRQK